MPDLFHERSRMVRANRDTNIRQAPTNKPPKLSAVQDILLVQHLCLAQGLLGLLEPSLGLLLSFSGFLELVLDL
jgi:hypothetical protein